MKLKSIILIASTLSSFHFSNAMHDEFEIIPEEEFTAIEKDFQKRFGYSIPTSEDDYQKMSFKEYINHNSIISTQENTSTESEKINIITKKSLRYFQQAELEKKFAAEKLRQEELIATEKLRQEKLIAAAKLRCEKQAAQKQQLQEKLAALQQLEREKEAENKRLREQSKELELLIQEETKRNAIIKRQQQKQRIIKAQKRENAIKAIQKAITPKQAMPQEQPNHLSLLISAKRTLMRQYNCKTEINLKKRLLQECSNENPCIGKPINQHAAFHYDSITRELVILIGKDQINNFTCCTSL